MKKTLISLAVMASLAPYALAIAPPPTPGAAQAAAMAVPLYYPTNPADKSAPDLVSMSGKLGIQLSGDIAPESLPLAGVTDLLPLADTLRGLDMAKVATSMQMSGNISYRIETGVVTLAVDRIANRTTTRTSGSLRLRLIASTSPASGAQSITGYRLFESVNFGPVGPGSAVGGSAYGAFLGNPPSGTYYMIVALVEYDSVDCASSDRFCVVDSFTVNTATFSAGTPPPPAPTPAPPPPPPPAPTPAPAPAPAPAANGTGYNTVVVDLSTFPYCYQYVRPSMVSVLTSLGNTATYAGTRSCGSLGYPVYAGKWFLDTVSWVFDSSAAFAQIDCDSGVAIQCSVGNPPAAPPPPIAATPPPPPPAPAPTPAPAPAPSGSIEVTEYFIIALNKYFITGRSAEKSLLDAYPAVYRRTGARFTAFPASSSPPSGYENICRFYLPPAKGGSNTHFYGRPSDCNLVRSTGNPMFEYEGEDFAVAAPVSGVCPTIAPFPIYRSFNNRVIQNDGNHRYTNASFRYNQMASRGWISEGPVFCSASAVDGTE